MQYLKQSLMFHPVCTEISRLCHFSLWKFHHYWALAWLTKFGDQPTFAMSGCFVGKPDWKWQQKFCSLQHPKPVLSFVNSSSGDIVDNWPKGYHNLVRIFMEVPFDFYLGTWIIIFKVESKSFTKKNLESQTDKNVYVTSEIFCPNVLWKRKE